MCKKREQNNFEERSSKCTRCKGLVRCITSYTNKKWIVTSVFWILQELLYEKHLSLDGSKLEETGFKCEHDKLTTGNLKEVGFDKHYKEYKLCRFTCWF